MRHRFEIALGALFLALWTALWLWQNPGSRIGADEAARYLAAIEKLPIPPEERDGLTRAAKAWMAADDGKPVYMLNLMRFNPELKHYAGAPDISATPREANAIYEDAAIPMLLKRGGFPIYAGEAQGANIMVHDPALDHWNRVLVVRYPSRRAFMDLVSDPAYREIAPYKLMALTVVLTPTGKEMAIPELPLLAGFVLLAIFLAAGWMRAARRRA
jgi:uncharacterized protein (DUF1330 family)